MFNQLLNTDWRVAEGSSVSIVVLLTGYGSWTREGGRKGRSSSLFSTSNCTKGPVSVPDSSSLENEPGLWLLLLGKMLGTHPLRLVVAELYAELCANSASSPLSRYIAPLIYCFGGSGVANRPL